MTQSKLSFNAPPDARRPGPTVWTVGQVVRGAHRALEQRFSVLWVEGELSNLKRTASGHAFFTLKDDGAALPVAMWRSAVERLRFALADGQVLRVQGRLGIFVNQGRFQMYAEQAEPAGLGARMLELEQRKARLAAEGLFDADRKRPIPRWPRTIGVVTSAQGAAIHDIVKVARRRCPSHIVLAPAVVQGPDAPRSLLHALGRIQRWPGVSVIIIGRGGGSVEDLWAFNDEALVRAIAACPIPVVCAVGHEVDVSLCDGAADVRAATPSHAAELVVPDRVAIQHQLETLHRRLNRSLERGALDRRARLEAVRSRLVANAHRLWGRRRERLHHLSAQLQAHHPQQRIARDRRQLERLEARLRTAGGELVAPARHRLDQLEHRVRAAGHTVPQPMRVRLARAAAALHALSPLGVLERGYAVVTDTGGRVLNDTATVHEGDVLELRLHRGHLRAVVDRVEPPTEGE